MLKVLSNPHFTAVKVFHGSVVVVSVYIFEILKYMFHLRSIYLHLASIYGIGNYPIHGASGIIHRELDHPHQENDP